MTHTASWADGTVETYRNLYERIYAYDNLKLAWKRARNGKTKRDYVINFESDLENNINRLKRELETFTYAPAQLDTFIVRDPKTRKISASQFRDRVVYHALCNVIMPLFEKGFIYDSFANQKGKGTHKAIMRLGRFLRKVCVPYNGVHNREAVSGFVLKSDVQHYFDTVDHETLLRILQKKIADRNTINLISLILKNHKTKAAGKGMPLGNLTSQFFANVYLNELDQFVKHDLKVKYYIRYVDDFVILHRNKRELQRLESQIGKFLRTKLMVQLHPDKSRITRIESGVTFLGFRVFYRYRLLKKSNAKRVWKRLDTLDARCKMGKMSIAQATDSINGWIAYAKFGNTYSLRSKVSSKWLSMIFNQDQHAHQSQSGATAR